MLSNFFDFFLEWDWQIFIWWFSMTIVSFLNIYILQKTYLWIKDESFAWFREDYRFVKIQLYLSSFYVFICAFRSFFPRADVQKIVIWDTWLSSVLVGRSVATVAELCLAVQLALFLNFVSKKYESDLVKIISYLIFPILFTAEWFSWYSVLTTNYIGNTIEESLWCLCGVLFFIASILLIKKAKNREKILFLIIMLYAFIYAIFMITIDVQMYYNRYLNDTEQKKIYLTISQGFDSINTKWYVTRNYFDWKGELMWMFLYFTTAVWASLGMIRAPFTFKKSE